MKKALGTRVTVSVHPAGAALFACVMLFWRSDMALATVLALAAHEGAHLLAMLWCGVKRCAIELTPFGGVADAAGFEGLKPWKQATVAGAGVAGSAACAAVCVWLGLNTPCIRAFFKANVVLALVNCLPVWPLDGARVLLAAARRFRAERALRRFMLLLSYLLSLGLVVLGLYGAWQGHVNPSLLALGPYLAYAAHESAVGSRIRGMERAQRTRLSMLAQGARTVKAYACLGEPDRLQLTRLLKRMPERSACVLYILHPETGSLERTISEFDMAGILFGESFDHGKE